MATGKIKTKTDKGFGFIAVQGSDDIFFHNSACNGQYDTLQIGQAVQFDIEKGEKGLKALNVVAVKEGDVPAETDLVADESMAA